MEAIRRLGFTVLFVLAATTLLQAAPTAPRMDTVQIVSNQGWSVDPHNIFYDNFDGSTSLASRYLEYGNDGGNCVPITYDALGDSGKSLRAVFHKGDTEVGGVKLVFGRNPMDYRNMAVNPTEDYRDVYWRVYVKHQLDWTGNPAKMSRATSFAGSNWSQAMIAHVWGGSGNGLCIDPASGVDANSNVVTQGYNDFSHLSWLGAVNSSYQVTATSESGHWTCIEAHVRLNTPGQSDGIFTLTIDGKLEASRTNLNWVKSWDDYGINAVFLENYWNSGSPVTQERYFDDFVVSTEPIGLAISPTNPTVTKTAFRSTTAGTTQSAWQIQVASSPTGTDTVWDSGTITGSGDSTVVDAAHGTFAGSLAGQTELGKDEIYATRVRQRDNTGSWSSWSPWVQSIRTAPDYAIPTCAGDFDGDGRVGMGDYVMMAERWNSVVGSVVWDPYIDLDADGLVGPGDYYELRSLWGDGTGIPAMPSMVPEPATLLLLGTGGLLLIRKRGRSM